MKIRSTSQGVNSRTLQLGLAAAVGLVGLGAATVLSAQTAPTATPAEIAALPAGAGRELFANSCSQCHALGMTIAKGHSFDEWTEVLNKMVQNGAQVQPADLSTIHTYLAQNFGPATGGMIQPPVAPKAAPVRFPRPSGPNQWPAYGGGSANQNYSDLTQITPKNVAKLQSAWTYHYGAGTWETGDQGLDYRFEVTPLMIGGVMYISTPASPRVPA